MSLKFMNPKQQATEKSRTICNKSSSASSKQNGGQKQRRQASGQQQQQQSNGTSAQAEPKGGSGVVLVVVGKKRQSRKVEARRDKESEMGATTATNGACNLQANCPEQLVALGCHSVEQQVLQERQLNGPPAQTIVASEQPQQQRNGKLDKLLAGAQQNGSADSVEGSLAGQEQEQEQAGQSSVSGSCGQQQLGEPIDGELPGEEGDDEDDEAEAAGGRKMFVGGLSWQTSPDGLRDHFGKYGEIVEVMIMNDPATRRSR